MFGRILEVGMAYLSDSCVTEHCQCQHHGFNDLSVRCCWEGSGAGSNRVTSPDAERSMSAAIYLVFKSQAAVFLVPLFQGELKIF